MPAKRTTKTPLRSVPAGAAVSDPPTADPKTITEAAKGTKVELLVAMRDRIAKTVEDPRCPPRDLASLSRRLMEIAREIELARLEDEETSGASDESPDEALDTSAL